MREPIILKFDKNTSSFSKEEQEIIDTYSFDGIEVESISSKFCIPWDPSLYFERDYLVVKGLVAPEGRYGYCTVQIPYDQVSNVLRFSITPTEDDPSDILPILKENGWL